MNRTNQIDEINVIIAFNSAFFVLLAIVMIVFFYFSRKKITSKNNENKNLEVQHQQELVYAILTTQEDERMRIAQDLHDDISSKLNIISLNSYQLQSPNLSKTEIQEISTNIINFTQNAIESSRRIAHDLFPPVLQNFGFEAGIDELCVEVSSTKSVAIVYKNLVNFEVVDKDKQLHLFRIVQELINNSIRHGKAKNVAILFYEAGGVNHFKYTDDGIGFDLVNLQSNKGLGMENIECRVNYLKGKLSINSYLNQGIEVKFNF